MSTRGSAWFKRRRIRFAGDLLRKSLQPGDVNNAEEVMFGNWWWGTDSVYRRPTSTAAMLAVVLASYGGSAMPVQARQYVVQGGAAAAVDNPPFSHAGRLAETAALVQSWETPAPRAQGWRYLVQEGAVVADNPPFSHGGRLAETAALLRLWDAVATNPPTVRNLPVIVTAADAPPPLSREWFADVRQRWELPVPRVPVSGYVVQGAVEVTPFARAWLPTVLQSWQPVVVPAVSRELQIVSVDNPPFAKPAADAQSAWQPVAVPAVKRATQIVSVDNPPFAKSAAAQAISAWLATAAPTQQRTVRAQDGTVAAVDNPPFSHAGRLAETAALIRAWDAPFPRSPEARRLVQSGAAAVADQPFARPWIHAVVQAWQPVAVPAVKRATQIVSVDAPPVAVPGIAEAIVGQWQPKAVPQVVRATQIVSVDAPPVAVPGITQSIIAQWQPVADARAVRRYAVQPYVAPPVDNPPPYSAVSLHTVLAPWHVRFVAIQQRIAGYTPGVAVDHMPGLGRAWLVPDRITLLVVDRDRHWTVPGRNRKWEIDRSRTWVVPKGLRKLTVE